MSREEVMCTCGALNLVHCPDADPRDPGGLDYDGFKCAKCDKEQLWPDDDGVSETMDPKLSYMIIDGERRLTDLLEEDMGPRSPWEPGWYHNDVGDCIQGWWKQPEHGETAERINNSVTLYKDDKTGEVIGVQFKNVKSTLADEDCNGPHRMD